MRTRLLAAALSIGVILAGLGFAPALADDVATPIPSATTPSTVEATVAPSDTPTPTPSDTPSPTPTLAPTPTPIAVTGAIATKWASLGGAAGILGAATAASTCYGSPCRQEFVGGMIFDLGWAGTAAVFRTVGIIGPHWFAAGAMNSGLGYPTGDEKSAAGGAFQQFETTDGQGAVMQTWRSTYGFIPVATDRDVGYEWAARGAVAGLGYPIGRRVCGLRGGGCSQEFDGGLILATHSTSGVVKGGIRAKWQSLAAQNGYLGYPTYAEDCFGAVRTCVQVFQGGTMIWSAKTGAVVVHGGIYSRYWADNFLQGYLGLPLKDEVCHLQNGGCMQMFQHGRVMWSPKTGAHTVRGGVDTRYQADGAQNSFLQYPVTEEECGIPGGGCKQSYQGGDILWSPKSGAHTLHGAIRAAYDGAMPGWIGPEGYPTGEEVCGLAQGGCYQQFQVGRYYWSPKVGLAKLIWGGMLSKWNGLGGPRSSFGYPTWNEVCANGYCEQQFQYGRLSWSAPGAIPW